MIKSFNRFQTKIEYLLCDDKKHLSQLDLFKLEMETLTRSWIEYDIRKKNQEIEAKVRLINKERRRIDKLFKEIRILEERLNHNKDG